MENSASKMLSPTVSNTTSKHDTQYIQNHKSIIGNSSYTKYCLENKSNLHLHLNLVSKIQKDQHYISQEEKWGNKTTLWE